MIPFNKPYISGNELNYIEEVISNETFTFWPAWIAVGLTATFLATGAVGAVPVPPTVRAFFTVTKPPDKPFESKGIL